MVKCALCGHEFDERLLMCHVRCPMAAGCSIVCCPNCGYQAVDAEKSQTVNFARRLQDMLAGRKRPEERKA